MLRLRPARSCRAESLRMYPSALIASTTRWRVPGDTRSGRFRTLLTVPIDTPAWRATSLMLADAIAPGQPLWSSARQVHDTRRLKRVKAQSAFRTVRPGLTIA
jgi:hypothetical protein